MAPSIIILAGDHAHADGAPRRGPGDAVFAASMLADTVAVARTVRNSRVVVRPTPSFPREALADLPRDVAIAPIAGVGGIELREALTWALRDGEPVLLISADLPHLPPWRLLDAFTYLAEGADAVVGPCDTGDWYLLGVRAPNAEVLRLVPAQGEAPEALLFVGATDDLQVAMLPHWFTARDPVGLGAVLRTMPPQVATRTRALLDIGAEAARAVGG